MLETTCDFDYVTHIITMSKYSHPKDQFVVLIPVNTDEIAS
jgi:hypothetical protein